MLCQEPWCFSPEQVERLTDWQVTHLYALPAEKRSEDIRRLTPGSAPPPSRNSIPHEPGSADHRAVVVSAMTNGPFKISREAAERAYDQQLAAHRAGGK
jgi:hypothetical protein